MSDSQNYAFTVARIFELETQVETLTRERDEARALYEEERCLRVVGHGT